jgi:tetratricopeptide (TPR) repeat protein
LPLGFAPFGEELPAHPPTESGAPRGKAALDALERILAPLGPGGVARLGASREEVVGWVEEYFLNLAKSRPLVLAIDDLHLADSSSLEFLSRLAVDLPTTPALVIATVGTDAEIPPRARSALEALGRSAAFRSMPLRALTLSEVTEFARWICGGRDPDPRDVLRWHAQTEGNPLFIEQLVRSVMGYGSTPARGGPVEGRDVAEILFARVESLDPNDRRVLTYASVLSKEFEFSDLVAVSGLEEERVTESLDRLVQEGLLREKGSEVYEFVTEVLRARVYADLTETRRRILHEKAGLALEAKGGTEDSELARQFYLGRDPDRAVRYSVSAAGNATRAFAFETAVAHLARGVEAERQRPEPDRGVEMRLLVEEGRLLTEMGSPHRSEEVLSEALALARANPGHEPELGRSLLGLAQSRYERGEYPSAEALAREAWDCLSKVGTQRDLMAVHRVLGLVYWRRGDLERAEEHQRAVVEIAEEEGTPLEQGHALVDVANLMFSTQLAGRYEAGLELYARAADLFAAGENYSAQTRVLMNRAVLYWEAGRTDDALKEFDVAIESAERARSPRWIGWCYFNLAQMQAELGRPKEARDALERAARVLAAVGDRYADMELIMTQAMIDQASREFDAAEANYSKALASARELHLPSEASELLFRRAHLSHERGDDDEARRRLAEARAAGVLNHRPDFAPRFAALEHSLKVSPNTVG